MILGLVILIIFFLLGGVGGGLVFCLNKKKIIYFGIDNKMKICNDYNIWKLYFSYKIGDKFFIFFF